MTQERCFPSAQCVILHCRYCIWKSLSTFLPCYRLLSGVTFCCKHAMLSLPCCSTFIFCSFVVSPLIPKNVTYLQNCVARGRRWSICFHCLFHKAGLICQNEHDRRARPQRRSSCIDQLLSHLPFLSAMAPLSFLSCWMGFSVQELYGGTRVDKVAVSCSRWFLKVPKYSLMWGCNYNYDPVKWCCTHKKGLLKIIPLKMNLLNSNLICTQGSFLLMLFPHVYLFIFHIVNTGGKRINF